MLNAYMVISGDGKERDDKGNLKGKVMDAIVGEAQDKTYGKKGAFQLNSFDWKVKNQSSIDDTSDLDSEKTAKKGKVSSRHGGLYISNFEISKETDWASSDLFYACCKGCYFPSARVIFRKDAGAEVIDYMVLYFTNVKVEAWDLKTKDDAPDESVEFAFRTCTVKYNPQQLSGVKASVANIKSWNLDKNTNDVPGLPSDL